MNFNKVIIVGYLTRDVESRYTPSGTQIASFTLGVNKKYKSGEETKEEISFLDCVAFGKLAELCSQYLAKGSPALVEGRLKQERWEKDGSQRSRVVIVAESVVFLSSKKESSTRVDSSRGQDDDEGEYSVPF